MSSKEISQEFLNRIADLIDVACQLCGDSDSAEEASDLRGFVEGELTELGERYDEQGFQGSRFSQALMASCSSCNEGGRKEQTLKQTETCGIRVRVIERAPRLNLPLDKNEMM